MLGVDALRYVHFVVYVSDKLCVFTVSNLDVPFLYDYVAAVRLKIVSKIQTG